MLTLRQAARLRDDAGQRLPRVWESFEQAQIVRRRGQLHLTAAPPGGYKSVCALIETLRMGVPSLYLSMDTDAHTMATRAVQAVASVDQGRAERAVLEDDEVARRALDAIPYVKFSFPEAPDFEEIVHHVWAYAEAQGDWPHWVVVDNLMDITYDDDENRGLNRLMEDLARLAKASKAGVHVLHHVTGEYEESGVPIPMKGLRNKVSKKPAQIVTLSRGAADGVIYGSVVKNRFGPADPSGVGVRAALWVDSVSLNVWDMPGSVAA